MIDLNAEKKLEQFIKIRRNKGVIFLNLILYS